MPPETDADVAKTVDDLKTGKDKKDLTAVIQDIEQERQKLGSDPAKFKQYLDSVNQGLQKDGVLPGVKIEGVDNQHHLIISDSRRGERVVLDNQTKVVSREAAPQAGDQPAGQPQAAPRDRAGDQAAGQPQAAPRDRAGDQPPPRMTDVPQEPPKNVKDNGDGSRTSEYANGLRITEYKDGYKVKDYPPHPGGPTVELNERSQVTFVDGGNGKTRSYHYDSQGRPDQIQGIDGKVWMRLQDKAGHEYWRREDGKTWQGTVTGVDDQGQCHYRSDKGKQIKQNINGDMVNEQRERRAHPGTHADQPQRPAPPQGTEQPQPPRAGDQPQQPKAGDQPQQPKAGDQQQPAGATAPEVTYPLDDAGKKKVLEALQRLGPGPSARAASEPTDGVYSPLASPGVGDVKPGTKNDGHIDTGKGNQPLDWRKCDKTDNGDGTETYKYEGELDDSVWYKPWKWGDTNFHGSETYTKDGKLIERHNSYDSAVDITFKTKDGKQEVKDVVKVDTTFNPNSGNYDTIVTTEEGKVYRAETQPDGKVNSFKEVSGEKQIDTMGDRAAEAKAANFSPSDGQYHPVRPPGIGEMRPGEESSSDKGKGIDWREGRAVNNSDGSTTYQYKGELEDSGFWPWNWGDTNFTAEERVDSKGNLISTHVKYDSKVDQEYVGKNAEKVKIENVTEVDSRKNGDGNFVTTVTTKDGQKHTFISGPDGKVLDYQKPKSK